MTPTNEPSAFWATTEFSVMDVEVAEEELLGDGGFVRLRRTRVRNVHRNGSRSPDYTLDLVERPQGADAVAVVPFFRHPGDEIRILLRQGLRPAITLARAGEPAREGEAPGIHHIEVVAGILEVHDLGPEGLRRRAALELEEELGLVVSPSQIAPLGPPLLLSPGLMAERIYFCCIETPLEVQGTASGDGSPLEAVGGPLALSLPQALHACAQGRIQDAKTELALRRLAEMLHPFPSEPRQKSSSII
jgi:ADP-ribose pyrophosphatase